MKDAWRLDLGLRDFREAWELQRRLVEQRTREEVPDVFVFVEHPHVITLGRKRPATQPIRSSQIDLLVYEIERGGEATYHGPGQLVGYPIVKLEGGRRDLHAYLRDLEGTLIEVLRDFGIPAGRLPGATGVWTQAAVPRKIASIGVAVRRWVTYHGFALNVTTDLEYFQRISPCGFDGAVMTSMAHELGRDVPMEIVQERVAARLAERFDRRLRPKALTQTTPCT